jgi:hypothetical protein
LVGSIAAIGVAGSNTTILTSLSSPSVASMRRRTSDQSSPPRPQPSGGIAIDRILRDLISCASAARPTSISSIRLLPRQWRLGRKIDAVAWACEFAGFEYKHPSWLNLIPLASGSIGCEVPGKRLFELKRQAPPHNANTINGIDQGFGVFSQDVASLVFNQWNQGSNTSFGVQALACRSHGTKSGSVCYHADDVVVAGQLDDEFFWPGGLAQQSLQRLLTRLHYPGQSGSAIRGQRVRVADWLKSLPRTRLKNVSRASSYS